MHYVIKCGGNQVLFDVVHNRLKDLGINPQFDESKNHAKLNAFSIDPDLRRYHFVGIDNYEVIVEANGEKNFGGTNFKILPLEDLFTDLLVKKTIEVQLSSSYKAIVDKNKVTVGCQVFPASKIIELYEALKKVQNEHN